MAGRSAKGSGKVEKRTYKSNGKKYTYWTGKCTVGYDPGTGKQIQRTITGKTQREVSEKLRAIAADVDKGTYQEPSKLTLGAWLDIWDTDYLGAVKLEALTTHAIQQLYNRLRNPQDGKKPLSPKSVKGVHGTLHRALEQAVAVKYLRFNPADACKLPRIEKKEVCSLSEIETKAFLEAIKGHRFEALFQVALFTGMRQGEILGLTWDRVDFEKGKLTIDRQLQKEKKKGGEYHLASPKNGKGRTITPAPWVMGVLKHHRAAQAEWRLKVGVLWQDTGLVFTNEVGEHLAAMTVYKDFKTVAEAIGRPDARFHDLRHTYAVNAIRAGDDIRTVSGNLGHATVSFTLDVYADFTEDLKRDSAIRMDAFIQDVLKQKKEG